jgi:hypothetical protein
MFLTATLRVRSRGAHVDSRAQDCTLDKDGQCAVDHDAQ